VNRLKKSVRHPGGSVGSVRKSKNKSLNFRLISLWFGLFSPAAWRMVPLGLAPYHGPGRLTGAGLGVHFTRIVTAGKAYPRKYVRGKMRSGKTSAASQDAFGKPIALSLEPLPSTSNGVSRHYKMSFVTWCSQNGPNCTWQRFSRLFSAVIPVP